MLYVNDESLNSISETTKKKKKIGHKVFIWSRNSTPRYEVKTCPHTTCTQMCIVALFIVAKKRKQIRNVYIKKMKPI